MSAQRVLHSAVAVAFVAAILPSAALAQGPSAPSAGPMTVEHMRSGFYGGGDVKVTDFNNHTAELIGGEGGWMADETFFIGGAFYGLVNGGNNDELYYGGLVMKWMVPVSGRVRVGGKALIGGGDSWTSQSSVIPYATVNPDPRDRNVVPQPILRPVNYRFNEAFFVFEPEATASVRLTGRIHLEGGISYRLTSSYNYYGYYGYPYYDTNSHLGGLTGTFGIRFF